MKLNSLAESRKTASWLFVGSQTENFSCHLIDTATCHTLTLRTAGSE